MWLLENWTDLGPNGWDVLLGLDDDYQEMHGKLVIEPLAGFNHFTMMQGEGAKAVRFFEGRWHNQEASFLQS